MPLNIPIEKLLRNVQLPAQQRQRMKVSGVSRDGAGLASGGRASVDPHMQTPFSDVAVGRDERFYQDVASVEIDPLATSYVSIVNELTPDLLITYAPTESGSDKKIITTEIARYIKPGLVKTNTLRLYGEIPVVGALMDVSTQATNKYGVYTNFYAQYGVAEALVSLDVEYDIVSRVVTRWLPGILQSSTSTVALYGNTLSSVEMSGITVAHSATLSASIVRQLRDGAGIAASSNIPGVDMMTTHGVCEYLIGMAELQEFSSAHSGYTVHIELTIRLKSVKITSHDNIRIATSDSVFAKYSGGNNLKYELSGEIRTNPGSYSEAVALANSALAAGSTHFGAGDVIAQGNLDASTYVRTTDWRLVSAPVRFILGV